VVESTATESRGAARLCLTCARRALLTWSNTRHRETLAARRLARKLGTTYTSLLEPAGTPAA
jgi:hypothetical protein